MKNIKRFEIDVATTFGGEEYDGEDYPLTIEDLEEGWGAINDESYVAEITINGADGATAGFQLNFEDIDALFDVLNHIRNKVLEKKPPTKEENKKETV